MTIQTREARTAPIRPSRPAVLQELSSAVGRIDSNQIANTQSPHRIGMALAAMGTFAMVIGTAGYWATLKELSADEPFRIFRPVLIMALAMSVAGTGMFFGIWHRAV